MFQILAPQEHQPRVRGWLLAAKGDKVGYVVSRVYYNVYSTIYAKFSSILKFVDFGVVKHKILILKKEWLKEAVYST